MRNKDPGRLLRDALGRVRAGDPDVARELDERRARKAGRAGMDQLASALESLTDDPRALGRDAYEYRIARPVLTVRDNQLGPSQPDHESQIWRERLDDAGDRLLRAIRAVGRIEVQGHPDRHWCGTGFLIREDLIATNFHVADEFTEPHGSGFRFKMNFSAEMVVSIDFLEEDGRDASFVVPVLEVLHMETDRVPDLAFLRLDRRGVEGFPEPLTLSREEPRPGQRVAAVGYPWFESRLKHAELMRRIFENVYDKKRVAPGEIRGVRQGHVLHDCSVLGGNSGSPLIDLETGEVVCVHHTGEFMADNFAVAGGDAAALLAQVESGLPHKSLSPSPVD